MAGLTNKKFQNEGSGQRYSKSAALKPVRVVDIILDVQHPEAKKYGGYNAIGMIFYSNIYEKDGADQSNIISLTLTDLIVDSIPSLYLFWFFNCFCYFFSYLH